MLAGAFVVRLTQDFGQPKVRKMRFAILINENVSRLQVAVQDAALMGVMNGPRHFLHQPSDHNLAAPAVGP